MSKLKVSMIVGVMLMGSVMLNAQSKIDEERMDQDIEVGENVLSTLIHQQSGKRNFFPMEVNGSYTAGYGVTFRVPRVGFRMIMDNFNEPAAVGFSYSYSSSDDQMKRAREESFQRQEKQELAEVKAPREPKAKSEKIKEKDEVKLKTAAGSGIRYRTLRDSAMVSADQMLLAVAKNFLADYGDMISQLKPDEKIIITNRGEDFEGGFYFRWGQEGDSRRTLVSVEAKRDDISQLRQGKITRDQFLSRLKIVNTESAEALDPDLEVLSSMFSRLYREDLSKTYYIQGNVTYERLKDFGVIYYMKVYSSNQDDEFFTLPTVGMRDVSQSDRDKKVKELYPKFESDLKANLIEYGRTLQSLTGEEQVVMKVRLTKCAGCGIPESLELSVKNSVLKEYGSGKITRDAASAKVNLKKVGEQ